MSDRPLNDAAHSAAETGVSSEPTVKNWLSILVLGLIWGGTFMMIELALRGYGPITVATARTTLGAVALVGLTFVLRRPFPRNPAVWAIAVPIGLLTSAVPFVLLSWGQQYVPSAFAGLAMAAVPLFVLPLAHVFSDETLGFHKTIGVILGFVGALVLMGPGLANLRTGALESLGQVACLSAALCYAVASIMTRRCPPVDSVALSAIQLLVGSVVLVPLMLWVDGVPGWVPGVPGWAIVVLGVGPTALAAVLRTQIIRSAGAVFMTLVNYQVPLWSVFFGAWLLAETLSLRFYAALAIILLGLLVSQWSSLRRLFKIAQ
ncbi:DMT family transporter [Oceaniglobus ichthyenteri]|uniref:DMT family transporter n=1 Tax=Oceaniglobus ichthyenteri TaxID=2136177 RepID=UPI000D353AEB|nr:DMT family transporter [Oceaniglobus ichthyenteri]